LELIILTGNIGCGKSTKALELAKQGYVIVNDDAISTMIGGGDYNLYDKSKKYLYKSIELYCVDLGLGTNRSVVADMPNMKSISRSRFIDIGKRYNIEIISYDWGRGTSEDLRLRMLDSRGYNDWKKAFYRKFNEYEKPSFDEGFDKIIEMRDK